jgi:hypothetical protein
MSGFTTVLFQTALYYNTLSTPFIYQIPHHPTYFSAAVGYSRPFFERGKVGWEKRTLFNTAPSLPGALRKLALNFQILGKICFSAPFCKG